MPTPPDFASRGRPCDLQPGDQVFIAWNNGAGPEPDHVETVTAVYADGTYDTVGANTGRPEGVWHPIRRDRKYLLGRRRPHLYYVGAPPAPKPIPQPTQEDDMRIVNVGRGIFLVRDSKPAQHTHPDHVRALTKIGIPYSPNEIPADIFDQYLATP